MLWMLRVFWMFILAFQPKRLRWPIACDGDGDGDQDRAISGRPELLSPTRRLQLGVDQGLVLPVLLLVVNFYAYLFYICGILSLDWLSRLVRVVDTKTARRRARTRNCSFLLFLFFFLLCLQGLVGSCSFCHPGVLLFLLIECASRWLGNWAFSDGTWSVLNLFSNGDGNLYANRFLL